MSAPQSVKAMLQPMTGTAPLADFIEAYNEDAKWWWRIGCGHHQNLFEAALDRIEELENDIKDVLDLTDRARITRESDD